ncbi:MAG TPA: class I SAM-dependent methyltransferase [Actinomycetales bacterium]|nr:class I SAM-dependent methyltransferase [Actinomycetales bacterium]
MTTAQPADVPVAHGDALGRLALDIEPFTVDAVQGALGEVAAAALGRDDPVPARRALAHDDDPAAVLALLWLLGGPVARRRLDRALPRTTTDGLERLGLVRAAGTGADDEVLAAVDLRPIESDGATWWLASDVGEMVAGGPLRHDHVLGLGGASTTLAAWTPREPVGRALDVGTGSGVQALYLARHARRVTATDLSRRALAFARFNAALNARASGPFSGRELDLRHGSLWEPVAGEQFDLVVSNPPFVISPRTAVASGGAPVYEYRDGGLVGDAVVAAMVGGLGTMLAPGGMGQLLGNWEHRAAEGWRDRVSSWLPEGLDVWVVQREVLDPAQYAETWARDGGHVPGTSDYQSLVEAYLEDFEARGVEAVGFGVVTARRPDDACDRPFVRRLEEVTGPVGGGGPMGTVVTEVLAAERWLAATPDEGLLDVRLRLAPDVTEERFGTPGAEHPQVVLLRQGGGLQRAVRAGTALAGLVGACDGDLSIGQIVGALATLLDEPVDSLRGALLPQVRGLVADGLLHR